MTIARISSNGLMIIVLFLGLSAISEHLGPFYSVVRY